LTSSVCVCVYIYIRTECVRVRWEVAQSAEKKVEVINSRITEPLGLVFALAVKSTLSTIKKHSSTLNLSR